MPAHNEEAYLRPSVEVLVSGLRERSHPFEIIIVENGSRDRTLDEAARLATDHAGVRFTSIDEADYGSALKQGFLLAQGEFVAIFDVDLVDLDFLDRAIDLVGESSSVIVVGSKRLAESEDQRSYGRRIVTAVFSGLLRGLFGLSVTDTHGMKLLRREPLVPIVERCQFGKEIFDTELILRAERAGMNVAELPVKVLESRPPRTSIVRRIPRTLLHLVKLRFAI